MVVLLLRILGKIYKTPLFSCNGVFGITQNPHVVLFYLKILLDICHTMNYLLSIFTDQGVQCCSQNFKVSVFYGVLFA